MENMIKVINDNLRNVMNGIREHKKSLEDKLEQIKNDMALKVSDANNYKREVENARGVVSALEGEITDLENDLRELNEKFGSRDFKEILAAGNKEISSKIIEKRAKISEQNRTILDLTEKARVLKDELVALKSQKESEESNLEKTRILEGYFCSRITDIINYSEEHPNELESLQNQVPQDKLSVDDSYDSNVINTIIDESIFEEIDEIQEKEPDESLIQSVLDNPEASTLEEETSTCESTEISTADQLENMIAEAKAFVEKNKAIHGDDIVIENDTSSVETLDDSDEYIDINVPDEEFIKEPIDFETTGTIGNIVVNNSNDTLSNTSVNEEHTEQSEDENNDEIPSELFFEEDTGEDEDVAPIVEETAEKTTDDTTDTLSTETTLSEEDTNEFLTEEQSDENLDDDVLDITLDEEDNDDEIVETNKKYDESSETEEEVIDLKIEDDNLPIVEPSDDFVIKESSFVEPEEDMNSDLINLGLDINAFEQDDLILLEASYDKENTKDFVNVMKEHNISLENIYKNVRVLVYVTSQNLKRILDLLSKTDAKTEDINKIFKYLDKVNISKLEQVIMSGNDVSMTYALSEAIVYNKEEIIGEVLGLDRKGKEILKKNATKEDYKLMNVLPDVIKENYDELNRYHVNNAVECITKYPHKFTLTNSIFHQMLDKYDTDDLVRCINKNAAVIDKL